MVNFIVILLAQLVFLGSAYFIGRELGFKEADRIWNRRWAIQKDAYIKAMQGYKEELEKKSGG